MKRQRDRTKGQTEIIAYKAFFKDPEGLVNDLDGIHYKVGEIYVTNDPLQFGRGGFHMCEKFEDCFKYLLATEADVELTLVKGFGHMYGVDAGDGAYDDTLGYVYMCEKMQILKVFSREEIIGMALGLCGMRLEEFLKSYPLTDNEEKVIIDHFESLGYLKQKIKKKEK